MLIIRATAAYTFQLLVGFFRALKGLLRLFTYQPVIPTNFFFPPPTASLPPRAKSRRTHVRATAKAKRESLSSSLSLPPLLADCYEQLARLRVLLFFSSSRAQFTRGARITSQEQRRRLDVEPGEGLVDLPPPLPRPLGNALRGLRAWSRLLDSCVCIYICAFEWNIQEKREIRAEFLFSSLYQTPPDMFEIPAGWYARG